MPKDKPVDNTEPIETEKPTVKTRVRSWWDNNKSKLTWFGIGALTGAGTVVAAALLLEPTEEQYEGDNEDTVVIDLSEENTES